ncbi:MAG: sulfotransferase family protein [Pseudomonadota bacterium]
MREKVFCVGFQKTGTSSMGTALRILGYRVHKGFRFNLPGKVQIPEPVTQAKLAKVALPLARAYTAFEDNPWCLLYRELDAAYPGSKFILTRRRPEDWVDSLIRHFRDAHNPTLRYIYGCDSASVRPPQHYTEIYEAHNRAVLTYFKDRPQDLLVFDLETADWDTLCDFLDRRRPRFRRYPHRNATETRVPSEASLQHPAT